MSNSPSIVTARINSIYRIGAIFIFSFMVIDVEASRLMADLANLPVKSKITYEWPDILSIQLIVMSPEK
jgi:hypothetical protein